MEDDTWRIAERQRTWAEQNEFLPRGFAPVETVVSIGSGAVDWLQAWAERYGLPSNVGTAVEQLLELVLTNSSGPVTALGSANGIIAAPVVALASVLVPTNGSASAFSVNATRSQGRIRPEAVPDQAEERLAEVMKSCGLVAIGAHGKDRVVTIFTRKPVSKARRKDLPEYAADGSRLEFRRLRPFAIGGKPSLPTIEWPGQRDANGRYSCGGSISSGAQRDAGTLGALVTDGTSGLFGLSCCHVVGGCGILPVETPVVAPGVHDVDKESPDPVTIGRFARALPFVANEPTVPVDSAFDAGLVRLHEQAKVTSWQRSHYDTPTAVIEPTAGMEVEKAGRTTALTKGRIGPILAGPFALPYNEMVYVDRNDVSGSRVKMTVYYRPMILVPNTPTAPFAQPGDSGSLVTTLRDGQRYAVGMVLGGDSDYTYLLAIGPILQQMGVQLVQGL